MGDSGESYAAFLSYDEADRAAVERLADKLQERGVSVFVEHRDLIPGEPWQEAIEQALDDSGACVVFLGPGGIDGWANERMRVALEERVQRPSFHVVPVLLPGSRFPGQGNLPRFLKRLYWADFREGTDEERALEKLVSGIRGKTARPAAAVRLPQDHRPYQGLQPFQEADADFFFGRSALTQRLVEALRESRFLAIVGPSGSGKSSVARAGLIWALRQGSLPESGRWRFVTFVPGGQPLEELAIALAPIAPQLGEQRAVARLIEDLRRDETSLHLALRLALAPEAPAVRAVLLVDQLEEIFTLCRDEAEQRMFIENLLYAAGASGGRATVVLTLRADFYSRTAGYGELRPGARPRSGLHNSRRDLRIWTVFPGFWRKGGSRTPRSTFCAPTAVFSGRPRSPSARKPWRSSWRTTRPWLGFWSICSWHASILTWPERRRSVKTSRARSTAGWTVWRVSKKIAFCGGSST